eukprot:scpid90836/ scgid7403/ 
MGLLWRGKVDMITGRRQQHTAGLNLLSVGMSLSAVLCLAWLIAFLMLLREHAVVQCLFTLVNTLYSLGVFWHTISEKDVRTGVKDLCYPSTVSYMGEDVGSYGKEEPPKPVLQARTSSIADNDNSCPFALPSTIQDNEAAAISFTRMSFPLVSSADISNSHHKENVCSGPGL